MAIRIKECRICGNKLLIRIGSLGNIAISNFTKRASKGIKYPLELVYCKKCTLLQLAHDVPRNKIYKNYWYESGINPIITNNLKNIAKLVKGKIYIDIGCNDGTIFKYVKKGINKIGVDPSNIKPNNCNIFINDYFENNEAKLPLASTITAIACLYDLPDPNKFIKKVREGLAPKGIFIAQLMTLSPMIENNDVGNICHEHIEYYSYKSLVTLYERNGLEIFKVEKNDINGGSYRIFARYYINGSTKLKEKEYGVKELKDFFRRVEINKKEFLIFMRKNKSKIIGYGASTKANTILQYYGIKNMPIVDINPLKEGLYPISSNCRVIGEIPDCDYLWVFPYGFRKFFKKKEVGYRGKWVTTIPHFKIF